MKNPAMTPSGAKLLAVEKDNQEKVKSLIVSAVLKERPDSNNGHQSMMTEKKEKSEKAEQSDDDDSEHSEDIVVVETAENAVILNKVSLAKLSRMGTRRNIWKSKSGSYFVILAFLTGYDTMNSFAFYIDKFGVGFCIVYFMAMLFIGFPLFYMELALGQFTSSNAYNVFDRMAPAMAGIGLVSLLLNFMVMMTDQMIITYFINLFTYATNIFTNAMPWHGCASSGNDGNCRELDHTCDALQMNYKDLHKTLIQNLGLHYSSVGNICYKSRMQLDKIDSYEDWHIRDIDTLPMWKWFAGESLGQHLFWNLKLTKDSIHFFTWPTHEFLVYMFLAWTTVYLICRTNKQFISSLARLSLIFTAAVLFTFATLFLFVRNPEFPYLRGTQTSMVSDLNDWKMVFDMLMSAVFLVLTSLRLGQGGVIYLGSQYPFRNAPAKDCAYILVATSVIPFIYAICHLLSTDSFFLYLVNGDMEKWQKASADIDQIYFYSSGHRIMHFVAFMQSMRMLKEYEPMMICLMSAMGIIITITNKVVRAEIIVSTVVETFPVYADIVGRKVVLHLILAISFMLMFFFVSQDGMELLIGLENLTFPLVAAIVVLAELFAVVWCYGGRRLMANIMAMNNRRNQEQESKIATMITKFVTILMWSFIIPFIIILCMIGRAVIGFLTKSKKASDPNVIIAFLLISIIPLFAIVRILNQYRCSNNVLPVFRPDPDLWGPRTSEDRARAARLEKMLRAH